MFHNVHVIGIAGGRDEPCEWDVKIVSNGELVGVIMKLEGPEGIDELAGYWFTDTFGRQSEEFDTLNEARDCAEQSINPVTIN